ncbi:MAG: hypothetical protein DHS20C16_35640 [Phycisphaerae bacterium]|nr:MAG: hypothetical protein DHS20C16_35640 [Phycisphaerae bacterium]
MKIAKLASALLLAGILAGCFDSSNPAPNATQKHSSNLIGDASGQQQSDEFGSAKPLPQLLDQIVSRGHAENHDDALVHALDTHANNELGPQIVSEHLNSLRESDPDSILPWCEQVLASHPGSSAAARAFDSILEELRTTSVPAFLDRCEAAIEAQESRITRVALLNLVEYYDERRDFKSAGLYSLQLLADHWDIVCASHLHEYLFAVLERAGWYLEAKRIRDSDSPAEDSEFEFRSIEPAFSSDPGIGDDSNSPLFSYYRLSPDVDAIQEVSMNLDPSGTDYARLVSRLVCIAMGRNHPEKAIYFLDEYATVFHENISRNSGYALFEDTDRRDLESVIASIGSFSHYLRESGSGLNGGMRHVTSDLAKSKNRLLDIYIAPIFQDAGDNESRFGKQVERSTVFLESIGEHALATTIMKYYIRLYPTTRRAMEIRIDLAQALDRHLALPREAAITRLQFAADFPNDARAAEALLQACNYFVETSEYEPAYEALCNYDVSFTDGTEDQLEVEYLTARCESGLGLVDSAKVRMEEIVKKQPRSSVSPSALFWLARRSVAEERFEEARDQFQSIIRRFPNSAEAGQARENYEKISAVLKQAPLTGTRLPSEPTR